MQIQSTQRTTAPPKPERVLQVDRRFSDERRATDVVKRLLLAHDRT